MRLKLHTKSFKPKPREGCIGLRRIQICICGCVEPVIFWVWGVANCIGLWSVSIKNVYRPLWFPFTQWEVELSVLDQLFWPLTAALILSLALVGIPRYLLSLSLSLSLSLCHSLSLSAVWQLLLPCCHSHWHLTGVRGDVGMRGNGGRRKSHLWLPSSCHAWQRGLIFSTADAPKAK